jgi:hypothetical protein
MKPGFGVHFANLISWESRRIMRSRLSLAGSVLVTNCAVELLLNRPATSVICYLYPGCCAKNDACSPFSSPRITESSSVPTRQGLHRGDPRLLVFVRRLISQSLCAESPYPWTHPPPGLTSEFEPTSDWLGILLRVRHGVLCQLTMECCDALG